MTLAYDIVPLDPPADRRASARLKCRECGEYGKIPVAGMPNNPERYEKLFIRLGWDADVFHPGKNWCPKCVRLRKIRANEPTEPVPKPRVFTTGPLTPVFEVPLGAGTRSSSMGDQVTDIKKLGNEQKAKLRKEIEEFFDDSTGRYLEGQSDHTISDRLQIARAVVAEFRENFYGELKEDPETAALREGIEECKRAQAAIQSRLQKLEIKLNEVREKRSVK